MLVGMEDEHHLAEPLEDVALAGGDELLRLYPPEGREVLGVVVVVVIVRLQGEVEVPHVHPQGVGPEADRGDVLIAGHALR